MATLKDQLPYPQTYRYEDDDDIYCSTDHEDFEPSSGRDVVEDAALASEGDKQDISERDKQEKQSDSSEDEDKDTESEDEDVEATKRYWEMRSEDICFVSTQQ